MGYQRSFETHVQMYDSSMSASMYCQYSFGMCRGLAELTIRAPSGWYRLISLRVRFNSMAKALREAVEAYDRVTGEPAPVDLSPEVLQTIEQDFAAADRPEVIARLGKVLGYLRRQRVQDQRVPKYVLQLAKGDKQQLVQHADVAVRDYRDVICAVENRR